MIRTIYWEYFLWTVYLLRKWDHTYEDTSRLILQVFRSAKVRQVACIQYFLLLRGKSTQMQWLEISLV